MAGSGPFIQVDENHVMLDDMATAIQDTITYTRTFADSQISSLGTAITNLEAAVGAHTVTVETIDATYSGLTGVTFPTKPTFAALVLDEYPDSAIVEPTITGFDGIDYSYTAPTAPASQSSSFSFTEGTYSSAMWTDLFTAVHGKILGGDYGLSTTAHAAMVAREQSARQANQDREYQALNDALGATGFNVAAGHTTYALAEFAEEIVRRDQDALNNITIKDFEIGNENEKFFITGGLDIEKMLADAFDKAQNRGLEAAKAAEEYLYRFFSENVKLYLGEWEGVGLQFKAIETQVSAIASQNKSETDIYQARADVLKTRIEGITSKNLGVLEERKTEVEVYKTEVEAVAEEAKQLLEDARISQDNLKLRVDRALKTSELNLQAYQDSTQIGVAVTSGIANIASQGVASALGAINTSLSNSYSGTENRAESWRHSDSISESHSYQEE